MCNQSPWISIGSIMWTCPLLKIIEENVVSGCRSWWFLNIQHSLLYQNLDALMLGLTEELYQHFLIFFCEIQHHPPKMFCEKKKKKSTKFGKRPYSMSLLEIHVSLMKSLRSPEVKNPFKTSLTWYFPLWGLHTHTHMTAWHHALNNSGWETLD